MIPENTTQNKAAFMALYWGQEVYEWEYPRCATKPGIIESEPNLKTYSGCVFLNLKPLSSISDEDAIYIAKLFNDDFSDFSEAKIIDLLHVVKEDVLSLLYDIEVEGRSFNEIILVSDFLRSRGYALPWKGLSVDDLVEYGWVKLQEVEK